METATKSKNSINEILLSDHCFPSTTGGQGVTVTVLGCHQLNLESPIRLIQTYD